MNKVQEIISNMKTARLPSDYWADTANEFPELAMTKSTMQRNNQSVWDHTMSVIDVLEIKTPVTLLSGLFHDLGKSCVVQIDNPLLPMFPNHAIKSAGIASKKLTEWGAPPDLIHNVIRIVLMHMYDIRNATREKTVRKFIADVGHNNIDSWFALRVADSRSYAAYPQYHSDLIQPFRTAVISYLASQPDGGCPDFDHSEMSSNIRIEGGNV